jgi:hypothetical protein
METSGVKESRRPLLVLGGLLVLLAAVAVAATGTTPGAPAGGRGPSTRFLDLAVSLFAVMMVFGIGVWGYILFVRRDALAAAAATRQRRSPWATIVIVGVIVALFAVRIRWGSHGHGLGSGIFDHIRPLSRPSKSSDSAAGAYRPEFATWPVMIVLALIVMALGAWYLSARARRSRLTGPTEAVLPALADVLDETLDDLRAEADPRRAVIAAYARMERTLASYGLPRDPSEAPDEYLQRIFGDLEVSRRTVTRLTALFATAKFSSHDVGPDMKQEAISALETMREELRAAEALAEHQQAVARAERMQRAAG